MVEHSPKILASEEKANTINLAHTTLHSHWREILNTHTFQNTTLYYDKRKQSSLILCSSIRKAYNTNIHNTTELVQSHDNKYTLYEDKISQSRQ